MARRRSIRQKAPVRTPDEIRAIVLQYFYDRNSNATSARGKKGFAVKISDVRRELKESHQLKQQEVIGNLNYLISQGWIEEEQIEKSVPLKSGTVIPQSTPYYKITAAGIDKIGGPGEFTMEKFRGIKIAAAYSVDRVGSGQRYCWPLNAGPLGAARMDHLNDPAKTQAVACSERWRGPGSRRPY